MPLRRIAILLSLISAATAAAALSESVAAASADSASRPFGLVIHGGAGVIKRDTMPPALEAEYRAKLTAALDAGYAVLERGGTALDAVTAAVNILEDSPLFNAGKGAVFTADGTCELDAAIMDGRTLGAGAIAGVRHIKNPVNLARDVMEKSKHVMMIGDGAEKFATSLGYQLVPNEYFQTDQRRQQLERAKKLESAADRGTAGLPLNHISPSPLWHDPSPVGGLSDDYFAREQKYGTVGCVALDQHGNLAAGTSTGGMTNKKFGRVGDVPVIGAGTYANNATCAVSATGWGEFFIRATVAHDISAQVEYQGKTIRDAATATLAKVARLGGDGGVIVLDARGNLAMEFNTAGMYRAHRLSGQAPYVAIYGDESK